MTGKIPFLFLKITADNEKIWYVKISTFDYKEYDSSWMDDEHLGESCLVPDVDQTYSMYEFSSEAEALIFIRNWWSGLP